MSKNETDLIANSSKRQLTAKGCRIIQMYVRRAAERNNTSIYNNTSFKVKKEKMRGIVKDFIFEKNASEKDLVEFLKLL